MDNDSTISLKKMIGSNTSDSNNTIMMEERQEMYVIKRNGSQELLSFDKILHRLRKIGDEIGVKINYQQLVIKVIGQLRDGITTTQIDEFLGKQCADLYSADTVYGDFASRVVISSHQKNTLDSFSGVYDMIPRYTFNERYLQYVDEHRAEIDELIDYSLDFVIDYFGFKTLEKNYLLRVNDRIVERPQHMWMRVAVGIHGDVRKTESLEKIKQSYLLMANKYFTHATPTLYNAGLSKSQLSSCYLIAMKEDSLEGIYNTLFDCAMISKYAGGIGMHVHNIRAKGRPIKGTGGKTNGITPMLKVFNSSARYVDQGGGKRPGSIAVYMEPWHADIEEFLALKKPHGDDDQKARDMFYGLWTNDLFMRRVKEHGTWALMCPNMCPGLSDVYGEQFDELYTKYEREGKIVKTIKARDLWFQILDAQMESGAPYILFKDSANAKSNQQNIGTIKSSNLCCEIIEYSDKDETAVCNLASIALPSFVDPITKTFNYKKLHSVTRIVVNNLDSIIDINYYPTPETRRSNLRHRPIGVGVQGLADAFIMLDVAFHSEDAKIINKSIFETIYHAALKESNDIARKRSHLYSMDSLDLNEWDETISDSNFIGAYSTFVGSPASKGILQFDMWNVTPSIRYDWNALKKSIQMHGLRNSLLVAPMPTASTSQILGFNECFEPFTSNIYARRTNAGEFTVVNKYLIKELIEQGVWSENVKNNIIANKGSVQQLTMISPEMRNKYKTVWEIPMKHLIDMSADRGAFICQSQSFNLWIEDPSYQTLTSSHFYAWERGLKTGMYYLRRKPKHQPQQFTIEPEDTNCEETDVDFIETEDECNLCSA